MADIDGTSSNENLAGSTGDDQVVGSGGSDTIDGSSGNDTIFGDSSGNSGTIPADTTTTITGYNFQVISLGLSATQLDPTESGGTSGVSENGSLFNGATYGSTDDPLSGRISQMVAGGGNGDGQYDGDNTVSNDTFWIDGIEYTYDGSGVYNNTIITYEDGTTATVSAVVFQDTSGNLYLAPESSNNGDTTAYSAQPITSIQLGTYTTTSNGLNAFRVVDSWIETSGADNGVDGDDVINGGAGSDFISGEGGNDTIDGGADNDVIYGDSGGVAPPPADSTNTLTSSNYQVISLGTVPDGLGGLVEIDPNETGGTSGVSENGGALNGETFGDASDPLSSNVTEMFAGSGNGDGQYDGDNTVSNDTFWINGTEYTYDGSAVYNDTIITYEDGTTATVSAVVFQDTAGNLYLAPEFGNNADTTAYTAQPITSIQLGTQDTSGAFGNGLTADRVVDSWVETTGANTAPDGNDVIDGGTGDDTIYAEGGSDTIVLNDGFGNDSVVGGEDVGNGDIDVLDASGLTSGVTVNVSNEAGSLNDGTDSLTFSEIESFTLTDQNDTLTAFGTDDLIVDAGAGNDQIREGNGNNTINAGTGDDTIIAGYGNSTITGGEDVGDGDRDVLDFQQANDAVTISYNGDESATYNDDDGDSGTFSEIEALNLSDGADSVDGTLDTSGIDISANGGNDTVIGGSGDDTIDGGTGNDSITGGAGNDIFTYTPGDGLDTITDFNTGNTGAINDGDSTNNDFIDLSTYYDGLNELWADYADDGILNQSNTTATNGDPVDYSDNTQFSPGEGIVFTGASANGSSFNNDNTGVVCFASGTLIETPRGPVAVETLREGDLVLTLDHGARPILWASHTAHRWSAETHRHKPIRIRAGAFGPNLPCRTMMVSPQHKVLARLRLTSEAVLVPALGLLGLPGVEQIKTCRAVNYHHLMLDRHEVLASENLPSESFYPGPWALELMNAQASEEVTQVLMSLTHGKGLEAYRLAYPVLHPRETRRLVKEGLLDLLDFNGWAKRAELAKTSA